MPKKKTTKKINSYICPHCKAKQNLVVQWQTSSIGYIFDLTTGESEEYKREGGDFECWACPACGADLPTKMYDKLNKVFGW